jgi:hypothetical protein
MNNAIMMKDKIQEMEMNEIFKVEVVNGKKQVSRWGFYADQGDGTYAIYKPEKPVCSVDALFMIEEDGPGAIDIVGESEIAKFLNEIGELRGIPAAEVSLFTPCGWYYDTIV